MIINSYLLTQIIILSKLNYPLIINLLVFSIKLKLILILIIINLIATKIILI